MDGARTAEVAPYRKYPVVCPQEMGIHPGPYRTTLPLKPTYLQLYHHRLDLLRRPKNITHVILLELLVKLSEQLIQRNASPKQHSGAVKTGVPGDLRSSSLSSYK